MTEPEDNEFAALFEASLKAKRYERGETIEGAIVAIGPEVAFVNVGGKGEATIDLDELKNEDGVVEVAVGDRIQAVVVSTDGGLTLSRKLARNAASSQQLEDAFRSGLPVEGKVERSINGGYEVRIGRQRAFCPISQIDVIRDTPAEMHIGRVYPFRIVEYREGGRNLVVSRRALLAEEQKLQAVEIRRAIVPDAVLTGRVASVRDFGVFVDLGAGVQGLLHVSEMAWSRVNDPASLVKPGDEVTVKVLRVDAEAGKIALGLKQLSADPWSNVEALYEVGQLRPGRVTRVAEFGAFVELEPGVEALAHVSTFVPTGTPNGWTKAVPVGTTAVWEILTIDLEKKRLGVAHVQGFVQREAAPASGPVEIKPGARIVGKVERHESFGVFVFLAPGKTGLIPLRETGIPRETPLIKAFPVGSDLEVIVLEVDQASRRIRLSRKAVQDANEADVVRDYAARVEGESAGGFGAFADKLRGALTPRE